MKKFFERYKWAYKLAVDLDTRTKKFCERYKWALY